MVRRVTRGPIVLMLSNARDSVQRFWLNDYAPDMSGDRGAALSRGGTARRRSWSRIDVEPVPIPLLCTDGFNEAYYGRPEKLLDEGARLANSAWAFVDKATSDGYVAHLRRDLEDGTWDAKYGPLRTQPTYEGALQALHFAQLGRVEALIAEHRHGSRCAQEVDECLGLRDLRTCRLDAGHEHRYQVIGRGQGANDLQALDLFRARGSALDRDSRPRRSAGICR